jgi:hypothetical protein
MRVGLDVCLTVRPHDSTDSWTDLDEIWYGYMPLETTLK